MGIFSSKKVVQVASASYNLAGAQIDRVSYLKSTVAQGVLTLPPSASLGNHIVRSHLMGPAMDQRAFFRWSNTRYPLGAVSGDISQKINVGAGGAGIVASFITVPTGQSLLLSAAFIDDADPVYWAEKHILDTRPEDFDTEWTADYSGLSESLIINYPDLSSEVIPLVIPNDNRSYLIAYYTLVLDDYSDALVVGATTTDDLTAPSTTGYTETSMVPATVSVTVTETVLTSVQNTVTMDPPVVTSVPTDTSVNADTYEASYNRYIQIGVDPINPRIIFEDQYLYVDKTYRIVESVDVVVTVDGDYETTTTTTTESLEVVYDWRQDYTRTYSGDSEGNATMLIYEIESGVNPTLDALTVSVKTMPEFFPIIPLRTFNNPISDSDDFPEFKKAYRQVTGGQIQTILDQIEENPDISAVDHAFLVHGVELNTQEKEGQRYLYEFFRELIPFQKSSPSDVETWITNMNVYTGQADILDTWITAQDDPSDPLFGTTRPTVSGRYMPDTSVLRTKAANFAQFDMLMTWMSIGETVGTGLGKLAAEKGDFWFEVLPEVAYGSTSYYINRERVSVFVGNNKIPRVRLYWQDDVNTYRYLTITGLYHQNYVYDGKSVKTSSQEAIEDADPTGFIVPLHYLTLRKLNLVQATQLAISNRHIIFNSYEITKIKWYQRGIFRVVFSIVLGVIFAFIFPAAIGLLGTHLAVGTALGFTGVAAIVAGAAVNAIAAMILMTILQEAAIGVFGEALGGLIGSIVAAFAFSYVSSFMSGGNAPIFNWGDMMKAENLLKLTNSVGNAAAAWAQGEFKEVSEEMVSAKESYEKRLQDLQKQAMDLLGYGGAFLDPLMFIQTQDQSDAFAESSETFLTRTLMTGSDIVEMSLSMIADFPDLTLVLPKPIA